MKTKTTRKSPANSPKPLTKKELETSRAATRLRQIKFTGLRPPVKCYASSAEAKQKAIEMLEPYGLRLSEFLSQLVDLIAAGKLLPRGKPKG